MYSSLEYSKLPEIGSLAALRAVVERGGVSEAAKVLGIGQPGVTKRLRGLEKCYDLPLLHRVRGRLQLTQAGQQVYQLAVQIMDRHQAIREELGNLSRGLTSMRLEATLAIGEHLLPDLLVRFQELYPDYKIDSRLAYGRQIQTHLVTGLANLALVENAPDHPEILVQKYLDDELWLVVGANHPLARGGALEIEQIPRLNFVLREPLSAIREDLTKALARIEVHKLNIAMEVGSTDAILEILNRGRLASFLPRFAVRERVAAGTLMHLQVKGFHILRTLWISRNRQNLDHPVVEAFIRMLRQDRQSG
ncbi:MAG: LysR family transcriptional regulator [Magnetococcales bacterium]|nr:LysR family transcriptional regulator [Magnetococcales bacterium]